MLAVKVLPKGQITLPKAVRDKLSIKVGDTLLIEERARDIVVSRGKTLLDFRGVLPDLGLTVEQIREKAVYEAVKPVDKAFIDTSVILRVLVQDDPRKVDAIEALLAEARESGFRIHVLPVVMLEIVWVLEKVHKLRKGPIRELAEAILNTPELKVEGESVFRAALVAYEERNIKFADAVIAHWDQPGGLETVYTYDEKDYRRIQGLKVIKP